MNNTDHSQRLVWGLPVVLVVLLALLSVGGSYRQPPELLRRQLERRYGISPEVANDFMSWLKRASAGDVRNSTPSRLTLPAGYQGSTSGGRLLFAHIGDGAIPGTGQFLITTFMLTNDSQYDVTGTLEFFDDAGKALVVTIGGVAASSFPIEVKRGEVKRLATAGQGTARSGWARIRTEQPLAGTCSFSTRDSSGNVYADVGVAESLLAKEFTLFADSVGNANTAFAVINPDSAATLNLKLELRRLAGTVVTSTNWTIPPLGHRAMFLHEIFPATAGITEFEGSVVITGDLKFGGTTLRTVGSLLTSVPMVPPYDPNDTRTQMAFPHVADGTGSGLQIFTTVVLFNKTPATVSGTVDFINSAGSTMNVKIGSTTASQFSFTLEPGAVRRFQTSGTGAIKTGWARVKMDKALHGAAIFHIADTAGRLLTEAGVNSAALITTCGAIADSLGAFNTGLAFANPSEDDTVAEVTLTLFDRAGVQKGTKEFTLDPGAHQALFLHELFPDVPGIAEFEGRVAASADENVVAMSLRQVGILTTSTPIVRPLNGFSPNSVLEFAQNLSGTKPAVRWRIAQAGMDLALDSLQVSAPALGVDFSTVNVGDEIGHGYYMADVSGLLKFGGIVKLVVAQKGSVKFDVIASGPYLPRPIVLFPGELNGNPTSGLTLALGPTETVNGEWNSGAGMELDLVFRPGIIVAPAAAGNATITTTYNSASSKMDEDQVPIVRQTTQPQSFVATDQTRPWVTSIAPLYFTPGQLIELQGGGFETAPEVGFRTRGGNVAFQKAVVVDATTLQAALPDYAVPGPIWVSTGGKSSNGHLLQTLFSPSVVVSRTVQTDVPSVPFKIVISQEASQLALQQFSIDLVNVDRTLSGFSAGASVGSAKTVGAVQAAAQTVYGLKVVSSAADKLVLNVMKDGSSSPQGTVTVEKTTNPAGLRLTYTPASLSEIPVVNGHPSRMEFDFTDLPVTIPPASQVSTWQAKLLSAPADLMGADSGITVVLGN